MQRKFIYLINPVSGTEDKKSIIKLLEKKTRQQNIPFEILQTSEKGNYNFLIEKIALEKITDIIICGGDGTVNEVASALLGITINIGIIPMGSGNGLAFAAGIKKKPAPALEIIFAGKSAFIDSFYINKKFSCMLCGLGFDALVAQEFARQPARGVATYIKQSLQHFFTARTYPFTIFINNTEIHTESFFISIANSNQFGNNVTIAPKASICDGLLDIVVVNKMSKIKMVYTLLKQVRLGQVMLPAERKYHAEDILYFQAKKLQIYNPALAPFHIDGSPATTSENFEIEIIEKAFRLIQP